MIAHIVLAVIIAVIVALVALFVGRVIKGMGGTVPILATIGDFLEQFCWVIGLLAGALYFASGGDWRF